MMFSRSDFYCVVAESDGRIMGSNCLDERSVIRGVARSQSIPVHKTSVSAES